MQNDKRQINYSLKKIQGVTEDEFFSSGGGGLMSYLSKHTVLKLVGHA